MKKVGLWISDNRRKVLAIFAAVLTLTAMLLAGTRTGFLSFANEGGAVSDIITKYDVPADQLSDYFANVRIVVNSKGDGYIKGGNGNRFGVSLSFEMDEDALFQKSSEIADEYPSCPVNSGDHEMWEYVSWFNEHPGEFEPVVFRWKADDVGRLADMKTPVDLTTEEFYNEDDSPLKYGSFTIENGELIVTLDPVVYFFDNMDFSIRAVADLNDDMLGDEPTVVVLDGDDGLVFESLSQWTHDNSDDSEGGKYSIEKTAVKKTDQPSIVYTITVTGTEEHPLNGKKLVERIPDGMVLKSAELTYKDRFDGPWSVTNDFTVEKITNGDGSETSVYTYEIGSRNINIDHQLDYKVTEAVFTVTLTLDDDNLLDYIREAKFEKYVSNVAELRDPDAPEPVAVSQTVGTKIKHITVNKTGSPADIRGTEYKWTINLDTSLPSLDYGYVADMISDDDHSYDFSKGIKVSFGKNDQIEIAPENIHRLDSVSTEWDALSAMGLNGEGVSGVIDSGAPQAYYYYIDAADASGNFTIFRVKDTETGEYIEVSDILPSSAREEQQQNGQAEDGGSDNDGSEDGGDGTVIEQVGDENAGTEDTGGTGSSPDDLYQKLGSGEYEYAPKRYCVLLIPLKGIHGSDTYATRSADIEYYTSLNTHGLSDDDYWEYIENYEQGGTDGRTYETDIDNLVKLLYKNTGADGEGPYPDDIFSINKKINVDPGLVVKNGVKYDQGTGVAKWRVRVNRLGIRIDAATLTDYLTYMSGDQRVNKYDTGTLTVRRTEYGTVTGEDGVKTTSVREDGKLLENGTDYRINSDGDLVIDIGDVDEGTSYEYEISAKVADPSLLATQSQTQEINNKARIDYYKNGTPRFDESDDGLTVPNTLLSKYPAGSYDKEEKTLTWTITAGREGTPIDNAVVTDVIPEGFTYLDGSASVYPEHSMNIVKKENGDVDFELGDIDRAYTITLKTEATQQWINDWLIYKVTDDPELNKPREVFNTAQLRGSVYGRILRDHENNEFIQVNSKNTVPVDPIDKKGHYNKEENYIEWTIVLNEEHADIAGYYLEEVLDRYYSADNQPMELVYTSIEVERGGTVQQAESEKAVLSPLPGGDDLGFIIDFPKDSSPNTDKYIITFRTLLTPDSIGVTNLKNRVYLKNGKDEDISESGDDDNDYDGSYDPSHDSNPHSRPSIRVHKTSINSNAANENVTADNSLALRNAYFALRAYQYTYENGVLTLTGGDGKTQEPAPYSKVSQTNGSGDAYFSNVKLKNANGKKLIFVIEETQAPAGYNKSDNFKLLYYQSRENDPISEISDITEIKFEFADNEELRAKAPGNDAAKISEVFGLVKYESAEGKKGGGWTTVSDYFVDKPQIGDYKLMKVVRKWESVRKTGELTIDDYEPVGENVAFTVTQHGAAQLKSQDISTAADGSLDFSALELDPGITYDVTEVSPPYGRKAVSFRLRVTYDQTEQKWAYDLTDENGRKPSFVEDDESGNTTYIKDETDTINVSVTKYAKYKNDQAETLSGVRFRIVSDEPAEGKNEMTAGTVGSSPEDTVATNSSGVAVFNDLPVGNYSIYEVTDSAAGYEAGKADVSEIKVYTLRITQDEQPNAEGKRFLHSRLTPVAEAEAYGVKAAEVVPDEGGRITNTPIKGTVSFYKYSICDGISIDAIDNKELDGAKFGLFRVIGSNAGDEPVYTAVSGENGHTGAVVFTDVEYGDYELREIEAPAGYDLSESSRTISREDLVIAPDKVSFEYKFSYRWNDEGSLKNKLHTEPVTLKKTDEDGVILPGITFNVYRRGENAVSDNGAGFAAGVAENVSTYYRYGITGTVTTDESGCFSATLPYGDYLIVEQENSSFPLRDACDNVALLFSVRNDGVTSKLYVGGDSLPYDSAADRYTVSDPSVLSDINTQAKHDYSYTLANKRRYGLIGMSKISADENNGVVEYPDVKLSGKTFEIFRKVNGETETVPYVTVKTDASGNIPADSDGFYGEGSGKKHLWLGEYVIRETGVPEGFVAPETGFEIKLAGTEEGGSYIWLSYDGHNSAAAAEVSSLSGQNGNFVNFLERGSFSVSKMGSDGKTLDGAEFQLCLPDGKVIANIAYDGAKAAYTVAPVESNNKNADNIPYLLGGKLLKGEYKLCETKVPDGYLKTGDISLKVTGHGKIEATLNGKRLPADGSNCITITDERILRDVPLTKSYAVTPADKDSNKISGLVFVLCDENGVRLRRKTGDGSSPERYDLAECGAEDQPITVTTDENGEAVFTDIPEGSYIIKEDLERSDKAGLDSNVYVDTEREIKVTVTSSDDKKRSVLKTGNTEIGANGRVEVSDECIDAGLLLVKTDEVKDSIKLQNVEFTLEKCVDKDRELYETVRIYETSASGTLEIAGLGRGSYRLRETGTIKGYVLDEENENDSKPLCVTFEVTNSDKGRLVEIDSKHKGTAEKPVDAQHIDYEVVSGGAYIRSGSVYNTRAEGSVTLVKKTVTAGGTDSALDGVKFTLSRRKDSENFFALVWEFLTGKKYRTVAEVDGSEFTGVSEDGNESGTLTIDGLPWGEYRLEETTALPGYRIDESNNVVTFTIGPDNLDSEVSVIYRGKALALEVKEFGELDGSGVMYNEPNGLAVRKYRIDTDEPLEGAVFMAVNVDDSSDIRIAETGADGIAYFDRDHTGSALSGGVTYVLKEKDPPKGYRHTGSSVTFTMGRDGMITVLGYDDEESLFSYTEGSNEFTMFNKPIEGTLTFTGIKTAKVEGISGLDSVDGRNLSGAEFGLYLSDTNAKKYTATSDAQGTVTFRNVLYDDYILREITAPAGYALNYKSLKADRGVLVGTEYEYLQYDNDTFACVIDCAGTGDTVSNTLVKSGFTLKKTDLDDKPLSGVAFKVYRRGSAPVAKDSGEGYTAEAAGVHTYYRYQDETLITKQDGTTDETVLPYGDYLLVEYNDRYPLKDNARCVAVLLRVTGEGTTSAKFYAKDVLPEYNGADDFYTVSNTEDEKVWKTLSGTSNSYKVVNERKFAYIDLHKVKADKSAAGEFIGYPDAPLGNKTFSVYRKINGAYETDPYFTVTTGENGSISDSSKDGGKYGTGSEKRHLWYGEYRIEENGVPDGQTVPSAEFRIDDDTTGDGGEVWISFDGSRSSAEYINETTANTTGEDLYNLTARYPFSVTKKDENGGAVEGAQFELRAGDSVIATLVSGGDGVCAITDVILADGKRVANSEGVPYIFENKLLPGTYTLRETGAPAQYLTCDDITVKVEENGAFSVSMKKNGVGSAENTGSGITVTDELILVDVALEKSYDEAAGGGKIRNLVFGLYDAAGENRLATAKTGENGRAVFTEIGEGKYVIKEELDDSLSAKVADDVYIDTAWQQKIEVSHKDNRKVPAYWKLGADGSRAEEVTDAIAVTDPKMDARITLTKADSLDHSIVLEGVRFRLEKADGSGEFRSFMDGLSTGADGKLTVAQIPRGSYRLVETATVKGYSNEPQLKIEFSIVNSDHGELYTIAEGSGKFTETSQKGLIVGEYIINEHAYAGFTLKKTARDLGVPLNKTFFKLEKELSVDGRVRIIKEDLETGYVYSPDESAMINRTDDIKLKRVPGEPGVLTVTGLDWGKYELTETKAADGYVLNSEPYKFEITREESDNKTVKQLDNSKFVNTADQLHMVKRGYINELCANKEHGSEYDSSDSKPLEGAVFEIYRRTEDGGTEENSVASATSDKDGMITFKKLAPGKYAVRETKSPEGYVQDTELYFVDITEDGTGSLYTSDGQEVHNNTLINKIMSTDINFSKVSELDHQKPVEGAVYALYRLVDADGADAEEYENDSAAAQETGGGETQDGQESGRLQNAANRIMSAAAGLMTQNNTAAGDPADSGNTGGRAGDSSSGASGDSADDGTENAAGTGNTAASDYISEAITAQSGKVRKLVCYAKTDENGKLSFDGVLYDTDYVIEEISTTPGSYVSEHPVGIRFTVDQNDTVQTAFDNGNSTASYNKSNGKITWYEPEIIVNVRKIDDYGYGVAGASMRLTDDEGNVLHEWITDGKNYNIGQYIRTDETREIVYTIEEIAPPKGYLKAKAPIHFKLLSNKVAANQNKEINFTMEDPAITLTIMKTDPDGRSLDGAEISVKGDFGDNTVRKTIRINKNGALLLGVMYEGQEYELTEIKAPDGYEKLSSKAVIRVYDDGTASLTAPADGFELEDNVLKITNHPAVTNGSYGGNGGNNGNNGSNGNNGTAPAEAQQPGEPQGAPDVIMPETGTQQPDSPQSGNSVVNGTEPEDNISKIPDYGPEENEVLGVHTNPGPSTGDKATGTRVVIADIMLVLALIALKAAVSVRGKRAGEEAGEKENGREDGSETGNEDQD